MKTAISIAKFCGAVVGGVVFVFLAKDGHVLMGLFSGALVGVVSGLMALGILNSFIKKEGTVTFQSSAQPTNHLDHGITQAALAELTPIYERAAELVKDGKSETAALAAALREWKESSDKT